MTYARKIRVAAIVGIGALAVGALGGCAANSSGGGGGANSLEITSWWTSGSESDALKVLIDAAKKTDSTLTVENAAVSGGGGSNARQALAARLQAGDPPDSWQLHPAGQLGSYVAGGQVADVSDLWETGGWADVVPADVAKAQQVDGKYYTVPIAVGRGNVLWTNPAVLEKAGVTIDDSTTIDVFIADLQKIKDSGATAMCLGDKDVFASSELLESLMMARAGAADWNDLFTGDYSFDAPEVQQALTDYKTILSFVNSDHSALTWDEAAKNVAEGKCGVNLMGDWAYGELVNAGYSPGTDFGWASFPESADIFSYVGDGFSIPANNIPNEAAAKAWLSTLMDPAVQLAFSKKKGSVPVRTDVDTSSLSEYQQSAAATFKTAKVVSSLAHAQASTAEFAQTYADAVSTMNGDGNIKAFTTTMVAAQKSQL
jgi:glucose/mannose transport system substrate-binding protein